MAEKNSPSSDEHLLTIEDLNIYLKGKSSFLNIVEGLSLNINYSEVFGLVGESGCGKSLTALSILRLLPPNITTEGSIYFHPLKKNILSLSDDELLDLRGKEISMIFQEPMTSLNPVFTIGYQIEEVLRLHEGLSKKQAHQRAVELLEAVKIPMAGKRINDYPHQLSGGMRQRVMIAMAIACRPKLLIADEPTTALDVTVQAEILQMLLEIQKSHRMSVLLITHDLAVVAQTAHRIAVMYAGRIVELARKDELFKNPRHPYTLGLLNSIPKETSKKLEPIPGVVPSPGELPEGCKFVTRCKYRIKDCHKKEPQLIDTGDNHYSRCLRANEFIN
ncbi:MAG: ABC transporter ATP-binding protein [Nitrospirae bacterium]|nr:ABC transporter ATP-binding protein [Nitrospirota bacterium]